MDKGNRDARVYPFAIGSPTIAGRAIALRFFFCRTASGMSRRIFGVLLKFLQRAAAPGLAWLRPGNRLGMLAMVTASAFLLGRFGNTGLAGAPSRRRFWRKAMKAAATYEEWVHAAEMLEEGDRETSCLYDEELVKSKFQELRHRRREGSLRDIMFFMRADLFRNLGNMCNPDLHKGRLRVPAAIDAYIGEVSTQLRMVCESDSPELPLEEKLAFTHETRHAFGRTALLLSGGANLGAFHVGVVRTLIEHRLLPRVLAGSSAGSVTCAIVGTRPWPEVQSFFDHAWCSMRYFDPMGGIFAVVRRILSHGAVHEIRHLQSVLRGLTGNLTFQEAYEMTGRVLGITVCSPRRHEPPRLLNYLTSPHVVVWSAVTASCAFPGLFEAQELMAKDRRGELVPYHPPFHLEPEEGRRMPARRWRDGGLENDLPKAQLKELFNVNHFIVSQANPHASAILRMKEFLRVHGGDFAAKLAHVAEMEVKHRCSQLLELGLPFQGLAKVLAQDWEGDVTVVVPATPVQYLKIIQNMSHEELQRAADQGRRCIWEKLSAIRANCGVELALDQCVATLNHRLRQKRSAAGAPAASSAGGQARFDASKRIPSWNCIDRSLDGVGEDDDTPHSKTQDGSDGESEGVDGVDSWTRSGGPLMRTASAERLVDYFRALGANCGWEGRSEGSALRSEHVDANRAAEGDSDPPHRSRRWRTATTAGGNPGKCGGGGDGEVGEVLQAEKKIQDGCLVGAVGKEDWSSGTMEEGGMGRLVTAEGSPM